MTFDTLVDWTVRPEPGIRHYSGTVTYRTTFDAPSGWQPGDPLLPSGLLGPVKVVNVGS